MSFRPREKRKQDDVDAKFRETPRKKQLNDAFKSLSIRNGIVTLQNQDGSAQRKALQKGSPSSCGQSENIKGDIADTDMRDPSSYHRDRHTIVINSLDDDDSDADLPEEAPRFLFNLPVGSIDTTFAGVKGIPESLLQKFQDPDPQEGQLVLYKGPAEDVINRTLEAARQNSLHEGVATKRTETNESITTEDDAMEID